MLLLIVIDSTPTPATLSYDEDYQDNLKLIMSNHNLSFPYFLEHYSHENRLLIAELKQTNPEYFI